VLCNNRVFLCFEGWGARLIKAFVFEGGDAVAVVGAPVANPPTEGENEYQDSNRCSAFKDRFCSGLNDGRYVDQDFFLVNPPVQGAGSWTFTSQDSNLVKKYTLQAGRDVVTCEYTMQQPAVGTMYTRYGLGPNQLNLMLHGQTNLARVAEDVSYRGLRNTQGGEAYVVAGRHVAFVNGAIANAGWDRREMPLTEQFETSSSATNWSVALAFSESGAKDLDGDGLSNTNEFVLGTNHEMPDTDGDGIPDGYEVGNGLNATNAADAFHDKDDDGVNNWSEFIANTPAGDSNSYLRVTNLAPVAGAVRIVHPVAPPRHYAVLYADSAQGPWQSFQNTSPPVGSWFATNPLILSHTFTDDFTSATSGGEPAGGRRFYTIRVSGP
jgi:hypothetical protein